MPAWQSPALNQPLAAPVVVAPPLSNYMTNYSRSSEDTAEDQMAQEDQEDQEDQVDPTSQTQPPPNNPSNQLQM